MTPCDGTRYSEKWCCGTSEACCTDGNPSAVVLAATFTARSTNFASTSETSGYTPPSLSNPISTPAHGASGELSIQEKAGIGVGAVLGSLVLVGFGFFTAKAVQLINNKRAQRFEIPEDPQVYLQTFNQAMTGGLDPSAALQEAPSSRPEQELPSNRPEQELP